MPVGVFVIFPWSTSGFVLQSNRVFNVGLMPCICREVGRLIGPKDLEWHTFLN